MNPSSASIARCLQGAYRILRIAERLQEQDPVEPATGEPRHRIQLRQIASDELQARRRGTQEVAADIDTYGGGRTVTNQLGKLAAVAASDIKHRPSGDVAQKVPLRRPLDKPIQRVLLGTGLLVVRSEF
ncbi:hypothetical protein BJY22_005321 [Kribbella shirazensis]|uniref:Uncharacterized protein n=1 Tax=Kribbella shirazensis TaxID=1105143 RepID=A0A7X5VE83_9ACTN|nr:hypothetical protein [Kribbella shirazensis]